MKQLPIPQFFDPNKVDKIWQVPYQTIAESAKIWARNHNIQPANQDEKRICLLLIDVQNTFCIPGFELFVGGKSGKGAVEDNIRLCEFIYHNLGIITEIVATMDTHSARQIFHPIFWVNDRGENPEPMTMISLKDIQTGVWKVNPNIAVDNYNYLQSYAEDYVKKLSQNNKYLLTIWPYHSILGGIGHSLVSSIEEALFFHNLARCSQTQFELKGSNPLTENYSVLSPEVLEDSQGKAIAQKNTNLLKKLLEFDKVIIAGQAKSHCVAWTIEDLLTEILTIDSSLTQKIYLLEDCTSPVVVPNLVDFTEQADAAFKRFANAGMNIINCRYH